jgi:hypothetical protein
MFAVRPTPAQAQNQFRKDAFRAIQKALIPKEAYAYFWQRLPDGKLEFAVPGWDVTSVSEVQASLR